MREKGKLKQPVEFCGFIMQHRIKEKFSLKKFTNNFAFVFFKLITSFENFIQFNSLLFLYPSNY